MAGVSAGGSNAAQISPEISDDEVFYANHTWRTERNVFPGEIRQADLHVIQLDGPEESKKNYNFCDQIVSPKEDEANLVDATSFSLANNTNNNRPGAFCSVLSEVAEHSKRWSDNAQSKSLELQCSRPHMHKLERQQSIVDGLLFEIYDRWHGTRADSFDSDTFTECSSTSEVFHSRYDSYCETAADQSHVKQFHRTFLESQSIEQLKRMVSDLQRSVNQISTRLVRQLKRRDRRLAKRSRNCDVVTAVLQAASLKRQIDTRMKFSLDPPPGQSAFDQWKDAMKAVNRLPMGIPPEFRKKVWLSLADHYIRKLKIDWHKTVRLAFNERSNPDDDKLGMQIVKDLHRTGCSSFSGQDNEQDRAVLKRVLLAYARWNKRIGYCQGFNVIAALLLNVMERKEDDALKVMIYLIDHVLPESYFANNLRALSVDMAVFRDLLRLTLPTLSKHLDRLQHAAQDVSTGACYEPPLTNVFTMQWFLTVFATCLPKEVVLRVWDAILLEGSEVLLRTALCLWGKLARRIMQVDSADEFYTLMGELSSDMMEGTIFNSDDMIKAIYTIAPFPFPQLTELREKYTYNIRPFSSTPAPGRKASRMAKAVLYSDEDELDEEELRAITSFPGMSPVQGCKGKGVDISLVGPGAYGAESELVAGIKDPVLMERMTTDITALKMQYDKLRQRQRQAHVIFAAAASAKKAVQTKQKAQASVLVPKIESPHAMNHLFIGKVQGGRNRLVTTGPRIAATTASSNNTLTKQLEAVAAAQAVSRSKRLPIKDCTSDTGNLSRPQKQESKESLQSFNRLPESSESCEHEKLCQQTTAHNENDSSTIIQSSQSNVYSLDGDAKQHHGSEKGIRQNSPIATRDESAIQESFIQLMTISDKLAYSDVEEDDGNHSLGEEITDNLKLQEEADFNAFGRLDSNAKFCQQGFESFDSKEGDSGIVLSSPSPNASVEPSPEKKALKSFSIQLQDSLSVGDDPTGCSWQSGWEQGDLSPRHKNLIGRCLSAPSDTTVKTVLTPTHKQPSISIPSTPTDFKMLCSPSHQLPLSSSVTKTNRPFNPFPVKHVNKNRAKTGLKLGLYTPSQLEHIQEQLRGGLSGKKPRNASS